jgi:two-component system response regulator DegU
MQTLTSPQTILFEKIIMSKKKLIIIDDHRIIRDGLKAIFKRNKNFEVMADFDNEGQLLSFLRTNEADLILMDIHLNTGNGIDISRNVKNEFPQIKILMHTMSDDPYNIQEAKKIGCEGYILKSSGQKELENALDVVSNGGIYYVKG